MSRLCHLLSGAAAGASDSADIRRRLTGGLRLHAPGWLVLPVLALSALDATVGGNRYLRQIATIEGASKPLQVRVGAATG
jgi:hypothetical protein